MLNNNNNNHNSSCMFQDVIVSYLYGETSAKGKFEFEAHLKDCLMCADELAGFGFVRSSLTEWRNDEVFALEMPRLENPAINTSASIVSTVSGSWLERLREVFAWFPALKPASIAFAVLIVFAVLAIFFFNSSNNNEIASNKDKNPAKDSTESVNKVKQEVSQIPRENPERGNVSEKRSETTGTVASKDSPGKTSTDTPKQKNIAPKTNEAVAENVKNNKEEKKSNVPKREVPKLAPYDEEEDNSLRLADLFEEIDTK